MENKQLKELEIKKLAADQINAGLDEIGKKEPVEGNALCDKMKEKYGK